MDDAFALLRLQIEWGADEAIDLDPIDRLRPIETKPQASQRPASTPPQPQGMPARPTGTPADRALAVANQAATLDELRTVIAGFNGCALRDTASNLVFAEGDPTSATLIIGEPPGREEDRSGHPFAGPEGQLLDQMLASIRLDRSVLMLTPLLPWRPPGGRPASTTEVSICLPFLRRLIVLLKPRQIVLFGGTATRIMLPQVRNRRRIPPAWTPASLPEMPSPLPTLALPSLADMLKTPPLRRDAWAGLRMLRRAIDTLQTEM